MFNETNFKEKVFTVLFGICGASFFISTMDKIPGTFIKCGEAWKKTWSFFTA